MNQLVMIRDTLNDLPPLLPPEGYLLRTFRPGDETCWETIIDASFETKRSFQTVMAEDPSFNAERLVFVVCADVPVATAAAWYHPLWGGEFGYLFFVAVKPEHRGKSLGYLVSLAALHQFLREDRRQAVLETDDHRIAAIKTYLRLGFTPHVTEETRERWKRIDVRYGLGLSVPSLEEWVRANTF